MGAPSHGRVVAGRYGLLEPLDTSEFGDVYRAEDLITGDEVAVKLLPPGEERELIRFRTEVSALRLLHLPGVARLLDEGMDGESLFLTMELARGRPFPGKDLPVAWESIRDTVIALLEVLARVHAAGVVHRDLKPANVLVDEQGRPTVLDFGLSRGSTIGSGLDPDKSPVGTPAYASPEQLRGELADARSDLYSLGVMVYEVLAGRGPQAEESVHELVRTRLEEAATPLRELAPDVPSVVAEVVDRLLARQPHKRPRSAVEVLMRLRGEWTVYGLPRLGGEEPLRRIARAVRDGRSVDLVGAPGTGRTRCLREAEENLRREGRRTASIIPRNEPFGSLELLGKWGSEEEPHSLEQALEVGERHLRKVLSEGVVLLVDDYEELDRWSRALLDRCREAGCVVSAHTSEAAGRGEREVVRLENLAEHDLLPLFAGPDRLFHLREDAARELWLRSDGNPARVARQVAAWVRAGLAQWAGRELAVDSHALHRLHAGLQVLPPGAGSSSQTAPLDGNLDGLLARIALAAPRATMELLIALGEQPDWMIEAEVKALVEAGAVRLHPDGRIDPLVTPSRLATWSDERRRRAHRRIAAALDPGSEGRLFHLIAGGELAGVPRESCSLTRRLVREGRLGEAEAALAEGLHAVRERDDVEGECRIFREWVCVALALFTPLALDRVLHELGCAIERNEDILHLEHLVHAAVATLEIYGERALEEVEAVRPFDDMELERWRQALRVQAARGCSEEREEEVLEEISRWAEGCPSAEVQASLAEWMGRLRYRQERYLEGARLQARAAALSERASARLSAMLNGASALLEACRFDEVTELASEARALAASCRHPLYEARSEWLLRAAAYRRGEALAPDEELVEAADRIGVRDQEALIRLTEAAVAGRSGRLALCRDLADQAARCWAAAGKVWGGVLARSLAVACGESLPPEDVEELADRAEACPLPNIAAQSLSLLRRAGVRPRDSWARIAASVQASYPRESWSCRREVLTVSEMLDSLRSRVES